MTINNLAISIDTDEGPIPLSARTFVPDGEIRSIAIYLTGISPYPDHCASAGSYDDAGMKLCRDGTAVLIPDAIGHGAGQGHVTPRYLHRDYAGLAAFHLLHSFIAQRNLDGLPVNIFGYSQGAYHGVSLLQRLQNDGSYSRLHLFVGGGIYDLHVQFTMMLQKGHYAAPAYIVHLLGSLLGAEKALQCFAHQHHKAIQAFFASGSLDLAELNDALPRELNLLFTDKMISETPDFLIDALKKHSLVPLHVDDMDVTIYHTPYDELCYIENLESYLASSDISPQLVTGSAKSHLEGSKEYFDLVMHEPCPSVTHGS